MENKDNCMALLTDDFVEAVLGEISARQNMPWNSGRINQYHRFDALNKLFAIINSGIPVEDFMFRGNLYRIHTPYVMLSENIDPKKERLISEICDDDSCSVLSITEFTENVIAFSKSPDFTRQVFYKVDPSAQSVLLHVNTGSMYGIDVNAFYHRYGLAVERFEEEREVLFPLTKETLVKEYWCTPNQFRYYMRKECGKAGT